MINRKRLAIVFVLASAMAIAVGWMNREQIGEITVVDHQGEGVDGLDRAQMGARVEIFAYITGWVEAPAYILIDQSHPQTPEALREAKWVPSLAYAIKHADFGIVILDTGLRAGSCDYGLRPVYWVPCRNKPGQDLVSQLQAQGVLAETIRYIVPSHFHGDHISGLSRLVGFTAAPILTNEAALSDVRSSFRFAKGIPTSMLGQDMRVQIIDENLIQDPSGIDVYDVFGDGSLKIFATPGHTNGHISAIARGTERDVLFTFDVSHLKANFELGVPSGVVSSRENAVQSIELLRDLSSSLYNPLIVYGHEPDQWRCTQTSIRLDLDRPFCQHQNSN